MITNANRSGSAKAEPLKRVSDERRSGSVSERETKDETEELGRGRRRKIVEVNGRLVLVDAT